MDLYFVIAITLGILTLFGVFESVLKSNNLNKYVVSIFLFLSAILGFMGQVNLFSINLSLNLILYVLVFVYFFIKQRSIKSIVSCIVTTMIVIALMVCYNSIDLTTFEYSFIQPFVYVALCLGMFLCFLCPDAKSVFCGTFLGAIIFEYAFHEISFKVTSEMLSLGSGFAITFTLITLISYCILHFISAKVKIYKERKI